LQPHFLGVRRQDPRAADPADEGVRRGHGHVEPGISAKPFSA
jgi:hypothetical protein